MEAQPARLTRRSLGPGSAWLLLLSFLLSSCAGPLLNSERIERQFGSYGVEILESSASQRVTRLYSLDGEREICRTLALVTFEDPDNAAITREHQQISSGGSIGAVFKENGWSIHKTTLHLGGINAPGDASRIAALMDIPLPVELAMHVYRFELRRDHQQINYATIVEIHHPDYLSVGRLASIYDSFPSESPSEASMAIIEGDVRRTLLQ